MQDGAVFRAIPSTDSVLQPDTGPALASPDKASIDIAPFDPLTPTIFHEPWWLEIATQGNYGVAEVAHGGVIVGRMPYHIVRRAGISYNMPPTLTHFLGPAIIALEGNLNSQFLRRLKITDELIKRLPAVSLHKIRCHRGVQDVVAFQANRFVGGVQFTGEIAPADPTLIWKNMRDKTRNVIRRAMDSFTVSDDVDEQEFMRFYESNLESGMVYDSLICRRLIQNCLQRGVGKIFSAKGTDGQLAAAIFCAWDRTSMYYLMSTRSLAAGNGAVSLLIWDAIQEAVRSNLIFDFDGFYNNGSILFCSGFGPVVQPRYQLEKSTRFVQLVLGVRNCFRERTYLW